MTISGYNNVYFTPGTYYIAGGDLYLTGINNVSCPTCTTVAGVTAGRHFRADETKPGPPRRQQLTSAV